MNDMTRREMLTGSTVAALGGLGLVQALSVEAGGDAPSTFTDALAKLKKWLADCTVQSRIDYAGGLRLHTPCVTGAYKGIWPDDFLFPLLVERSLLDEATLSQALELITESVVGLPHVPDRIEPDGMPVMQPGALDGPHAQHMPLHLRNSPCPSSHPALDT